MRRILPFLLIGFVSGCSSLMQKPNPAPYSPGEKVHLATPKSGHRETVAPHAQAHINFGTNPNDHTGDTPRAWAMKDEANFSEIYTALAALGGTNPSLSRAFLQLTNPVNVTWFGVDNTGTNNAGPTVQSLISTLGSDFALYFPKGKYLFTSTLQITGDRVRIYGDGQGATTLNFAPTTNCVLFDFGKGTETAPLTGKNVQYQCSLEEMSIMGSGSATKTAIRVSDSSSFLLSSVLVDGFYGNNLSKALEYHGRELFRMEHCRLYGDYPRWLGLNPNSYLACDHFRATDNILGTTDTTTDINYIEPGTFFQTSEFSLESWDGGKNGWNWNDYSGTNSATSQGLRFSMIRPEQGSDTNGWMFYINMKGSHNGGPDLQDLEFDQITGNQGSKGFFLRNVTDASFKHVRYTGFGLTFLDEICIPYVSTLTFNHVWCPENSPVVLCGFSESGVRKGVTVDTLPPVASFTALGTTNYIYAGHENFGGSADANVFANATDSSGGSLETVSIVAKSSVATVPGFGPRLTLKAHNNTNGVATVGAIESIWNNSTNGVEQGQTTIYATQASTDLLPMLTLRGDGRALFSQGIIQVDDVGTPINLGTAGGIVQKSGSAWWRATRNQSHGGLELGIITASSTNTLLTLNGSDKNLYLGDSGNLTPELFFWSDNSGPSIKGLAQGLLFNTRLSPYIITNATGINLGLSSGVVKYTGGTLQNAGGTFSADQTGNLNAVTVNVQNALETDADGTAGNTRLILWDVSAGTFKRVSVGATDSMGTGFRGLRVPN